MRFSDALQASLLVTTLGCSALGFGALSALLGHRLWRMRARIAEAIGEREAALDARATAIRILRLSASELRAPALALKAHAEHLCTTHHAGTIRRGEAIAAVTDQLLDLADDLQDHAVPTAGSRAIRAEWLHVAPMIEEAIGAVQASLIPGRRFWRIAPGIAGLQLLADRRALAQILPRVLGHAARYSQDGDWIDVAVENLGDSVALVIEDEGIGLHAIDGAGLPSHPAQRGMSLGLSLARALVEAHGGTLSVESAPRVGSRTVIAFPYCRVREDGEHGRAQDPTDDPADYTTSADRSAAARPHAA